MTTDDSPSPFDEIPPPPGAGADPGMTPPPPGAGADPGMIPPPPGAGADPGMIPPPLAKPSLSRRLLHGAGLIRIGIIAVVGIGALVSWMGRADRDDSGAITDAGDLGTDDLRVGDCLIDPGEGTFSETRGVPCEEPHDLELYHTFEMSAATDTFPSEDVLIAAVGSGCLPSFETYVGTSYDDTPDLDITFFSPTEDSWKAGDRTITCLILDINGNTLEGSVRNRA